MDMLDMLWANYVKDSESLTRAIDAEHAAGVYDASRLEQSSKMMERGLRLARALEKRRNAGGKQ